MKNDQIKMVETILSELNRERDRDILIRYFIHEQDKKVICASEDIEPGYFDKVILERGNGLRLSTGATI